MKIISHRGNLCGALPEKENHPLYIGEALRRGFEVEIDVWRVDDKYFLGHDKPTYFVDDNFFNEKMWVHCKNLEAVEEMSRTAFNWFWHQEDKITLTSKGVVWCHAGVIVENGIVVECGKPFQISKNAAGICTDYPLAWNKMR